MVTFNANRSVDQVIVDAGASLHAFNSTITIANGAGDDLITMVLVSFLAVPPLMLLLEQLFLGLRIFNSMEMLSITER